MSNPAVDSLFDPANVGNEIGLLSGIYTNPAGVESEIYFYFQDPHAYIQIQEIAVQSAAPIAVCRTEDVSDAGVGATLVFNATTFYIVEVQPDGTGVTHLILSLDKSA